MAVLADKVAQGGRLTMAEQGIVITNAAKVYSSMFGPSVEDFRLKPMPLPENIKGVLASFSL